MSNAFSDNDLFSDDDASPHKDVDVGTSLLNEFLFPEQERRSRFVVIVCSMSRLLTLLCGVVVRR